jgi:redox-sensitive bicupin YhaK (pirin superfamily)
MQSIAPRKVDLGGLTVRRLLPRSARRLIGPWCFLDLVGPLAFTSPAMDVPPHPHIGIQTATWLLEGEMLHKDSLGSEALARPGVVNLMTAGQGIAHSEETPASHSGRLHAVQLWVALPDAHRHAAPAFDAYRERPIADLRGGRATVILGDFAGTRGLGRTFSPLVAAEISVDPGAEVELPLREDFEHGLIPLVGACTSNGEDMQTDSLYYLEPGRASVTLRASQERPTRVLLIGGAPFGESILMWWNFVARTNEEIVAARDDWQAGRRFGDVTRYAGPRLEAPAFKARSVAPNPMS